MESNNTFNANVLFCDGSNNCNDYKEHPKIYINVESGKELKCPYCGKKFSC